MSVRLLLVISSSDSEEEMANQMFISPFRLPLVIEQVEDGSFMATSPALEGFLVLADTVEEVISLAPGIAKALIETMRDDGVMPPLGLEELPFPIKLEILVV